MRREVPRARSGSEGIIDRVARFGRRGLGGICVREVDGYDLASQQYDDVLDVAERALGVRLQWSARTYGTSGATVGMRTDANTWLRLAWRPIERTHEQSWVGAEHASVISGARKPTLYRSHRWLDAQREVVWRADEMELVRSPRARCSGQRERRPSGCCAHCRRKASLRDGLPRGQQTAVPTDRSCVRFEGHLPRRAGAGVVDRWSRPRRTRPLAGRRQPGRSPAPATIPAPGYGGRGRPHARQADACLLSIRGNSGCGLAS